MNVLFRSPVGALLARPWLDSVGLTGLRRYFPLSRLWAAANAAGVDVARFREEIGAPLPLPWPAVYLRDLLRRNAGARDASATAREKWECALFEGGAASRELDWRRRVAATRHISTRALFYPLLFPRRAPTARWRVQSPEVVDRDLGPFMADPGRLYALGQEPVGFQRSAEYSYNRVREYWLRVPTPAPRLRSRTGSEMLYARVVESIDDDPRHTLIFGSGLCLETELLAVARDPAARLAELGWRVIEPISPYHGLRAMPGYYGGETFFAEGPTSAIDLIAGQAIESAALIGWARERFGAKVALAGISMTSFVAQQVASHCAAWPLPARPDAVLLISHSGRVEDVTFGGELAAVIGLDRALTDAGWSRERLAKVSRLIDPAAEPGLPPRQILSVLGETDRWVPYRHGLGLAQQWKLPEQNVFRYPLGHLGMPVQLLRDSTPFERLRQVLDAG
jgi:hypothetical protein